MRRCWQVEETWIDYEWDERQKSGRPRRYVRRNNTGPGLSSLSLLPPLEDDAPISFRQCKNHEITEPVQ